MPDSEETQELERAFGRIGLSESAAVQAARGRERAPDPPEDDIEGLAAAFVWLGLSESKAVQAAIGRGVASPAARRARRKANAGPTDSTPREVQIREPVEYVAQGLLDRPGFTSEVGQAVADALKDRTGAAR